MNPKIFKGRTVEEATEEALKTLNEELENLEIKILDTGRNGILGLGGHPAEIEVHILGESKSESEKPKKSTRKPKKDTKSNKISTKKRIESRKKNPKKRLNLKKTMLLFQLKKILK